MTRVVMKDNTVTIFHLGVLILISYFTIFTNNELPYLDIMEIRNIVTAREMVSDNNWLMPTMNGETRIAKPPLPTWLTAIPIAATNSDDQLRSIRIPAGITAITLVFFVYFLARALSDSPMVALLSGTVIASSEFLITMGKRASWDIFCHTFMIGAIYLLFVGWKKEKCSLWIFGIAGGLLGLSFLSKGPIAFHSLLLPFLISYIFAFGYKTISLKWKGVIIAIIVCSIISILWPLYLYQYLPDTALTVGATEINTWVAKKTKPMWYYLPFPIHSGVWVCFLISALTYPLFNKRKFFGEEKKNYIFLVTWMFLIVGLLTLVPKKSTHYLLPVIIPTSLMIGLFIRNLITVYSEEKETTTDKTTVFIHLSIVLLLTITSLALCLYHYFWARPDSTTINSLPLLTFSAIPLIGYYFYKKREIFKLFITTLVFVAAFCLFIPPIVTPMIDQKSFMTLKKSREETQGKNISFYSSYEMGIKEIWAVGKKVKNLDLDSLEATHESFAYFSKKHPDLLFHEKQNLLKRIQSVNFYVDHNSKKSWYLSIISKS